MGSGRLVGKQEPPEQSFESLQRKTFHTLGKMARCGIIPLPPLTWSYLLDFLCYWHSPGSSWRAAGGEGGGMSVHVCAHVGREGLSMSTDLQKTLQ